MGQGKARAFLCACALSAAFVSGCGKMENASPEDGYSTDFAMSAIEYSLFLNKEITAAENILFTRYLCAKDLGTDAGATEAELESASEAASKIASIIDEVTVTMPATGYEGSRQDALDLMEDAKAALEGYIDGLKAGGPADADALQSCCLALSGEANVYYQ